MTEKLKKYQIVVKGQRNDLCPVEPHMYYVQAENQSDANERALSIFHNAYPDAVDVRASAEKWGHLPAIVCMAIACLLSFIPWHMGKVVFSITPSMLSTMIAIGLYSAVIIRIKGLQNSFNSASETILSCLTILFCASFISFFCGETKIQILWFNIFISGKILLTIAVLLSWIGMAAVAGLVWIILFILAGARLLIGDAAMGFWGNIYALSGFLGIVFQLKQQNPNFLETLSKDLVTVAARTQHRIVRDTGTTVKSVKGMTHS